MGVEKSAEAIVVAARWRRAESAVRSRTWIAQPTGKKSKAGDRGNLATKGGEVECRDMGARCQSGCDEKRTREHAERTALNCGNREVPATGTLRGVGGEAFLPYPICFVTNSVRCFIGVSISHFNSIAAAICRPYKVELIIYHRYCRNFSLKP